MPPHAPDFAPDMATALIGAGVRGVIVTGWEVDDAAAALFGETFWRHMLEGRSLGEAALDARATTWQAFPELDTFGAYQVYGDAEFRQGPEELVGEEVIAPCREVHDLVSRVMRDLRSDDDERAEHLRKIEAQLSDAWEDDAGVALTLGRAWASIDDADARLRALLWLQHAATREQGAQLEAVELMVRAWMWTMWTRRPARSTAEDVQALGDSQRLLDLDGRPPAPRNLHPETLHPDDPQQQAALQDLLGFSEPDAWRLRFGGQAGLWPAGEAMRRLDGIHGLFPTATRAATLANSRVAAALWMTEREALRRTLAQAQDDYEQASGSDGPSSLRPLVTRLVLYLMLAKDLAAGQAEVEAMRSRIVARMGGSETDFWSRVARLDLEQAARLYQRLRGAGCPRGRRSRGPPLRRRRPPARARSQRPHGDPVAARAGHRPRWRAGGRVPAGG